MKSYTTTEIKLGKSRGAPRVWLEGKRLEAAGFAPGKRYALTIGDHRVTLTLRADGTRVVSSKTKADATLPVIDVNSAQALGVFEGLARLRVIICKDAIHLLPLATQKQATERLERIETKLSDGTPLRVGSLCHGGGVLSLALHEGMKEAGVASELGFANDIDEEVLVHASQVNPLWNTDTASIAAPMQEVVADDWLLKQLGHCDALEIGIPCVAASLAGRAKKGLTMPEEDPNAGHLVVSALGIIRALNPALVVIENVVSYQSSASAHLIRHTLRDWGYVVHETVLEAKQFNCIEDRKRMVLVAVTAGLSIDLGEITLPATDLRTLGDYLEEVPLDAACWSTMDYLREKEARDIADGKGFRMQILGPEAERVGTVGAAYQKNRSTEPKIKHPIQGDALLRLLTPTEHARIKGVPETLIAGLPATRAHHLLGNGICFAPFVALGKTLGRQLRAHQRTPSPRFELTALAA